ncbi:MAG: hypothetical protein KDE53_00785 [Caldilineaceae bacterium]|nr:hypothetical protein [Caldilineaceae bacterium]MCB0189176.1 hypothetical protein [Caldilineaceae bacterium]
MLYDVLLTKDPHNGYTARPLLAPELTVTGETEAETLSRVQTALAKLYSQSRIVQVEVPVTDDNSRLRNFDKREDGPESEEHSVQALTGSSFLLSMAGTFSSNSQGTSEEVKSIIQEVLLKKHEA